MSQPGLNWSPAADGRIEQARFVFSPNHDARPPGETVRLLVIHAISLPPGEFGGDGIERLFTNRIDPEAHPYYREIRELKVSSHFLIKRDGLLEQYVPCDLRAWHAGVSNWRGRERCNDFSIGIELEGCDEAAFTEDQYRVLRELIAALRGRYAIDEIVGHSDIAPGRKTDPGPCFDWKQIV